MLPLLKIAFCTALLGVFPVNATDWSQWRGGHRDGAAPGAPWAASLAGIELQWRVPVGKGYPGPVVGGDRVFVVETVDKKTVGCARVVTGDRATVVASHLVQYG